jgi:curli biogenesis system outer membrane secretion channel CsgG
MRRCLSGLTLLLAVALLSTAVTAAEQASPKAAKKRVAVFTFQDKTDENYHWWNGKGVGEGMADMLATALVKSGRYRVMERQEMDKLLGEQHLAESGVVTPESAAKAGKMLGVELAVIGAVTEFGYKERSTGGALKKFGVGGGVSQYTSVVGIDVRFVNTTTGEILKADNVRRQKSAMGLNVDTRSVNFDSESKFDDSLVGKATREAVEDVVKLLDQQGGAATWEAKVVSVKEGEIIINSGSEAGVKVGDKFFIYHIGEEMKDPDTGESLGSEETKIGVIEVVNNSFGGKGKASICKIVQSFGTPVAGDVVRQK